MQAQRAVLEFWFGTEPDDAAVAKARASLWWSKQSAVDADMRTLFETNVLAAERGELDDWRTTPHGLLALILLTDQFPRNIYRDTPAAFRCDSLARQLCVQMIEQGSDRLLRPIERVFAYLPLEHSESLADQRRSVALFEEMREQATDALRPALTGFADFARRHLQIIERFGRFPHRNGILGRESSAEELAFLQQPGSSF